jgi:hypothetical protein
MSRFALQHDWLSSHSKFSGREDFWKMGNLFAKPRQLPILPPQKWQEACNSRDYAAEQAGKFQCRDLNTLVCALDPHISAKIDRDLDRTFSSSRHPLFERGRDAQGPKLLKELLVWMALLDPEIGYCQGMNFVAGFVLLQMYPERKAQAGSSTDIFWVFASIMKNARVLFQPKMTGYLIVLAAYQQCLPALSPELALHLDENELEGQLASLYLQDWLHALFCRSGVPPEVSLSLWGWFIQATSAKELCLMLLRASLAVILGIQEEIMRMKGTQACLWKLKNPPWGTSELLQPDKLVFRAAGMKLPIDGAMLGLDAL